jgi:hypothetical protein
MHPGETGMSNGGIINAVKIGLNLIIESGGLQLVHEFPFEIRSVFMKRNTHEI